MMHGQKNIKFILRLVLHSCSDS